MSWTERDGPPVSAPKRRGFGTIVTNAMVERSVDGKVDIDYAPAGLTWRLACPASAALDLWGPSQPPGAEEKRISATEKMRLILKRLAQVNGEIAAAEQHVTRQREIVAQLEHHGRDSSGAKQLLN